MAVATRTVLNVLASWCPLCGKQIAELTSVYNDLSPKGRVMIGAAADARILEATKPEAELANVKSIITLRVLCQSIRASLLVRFVRRFKRATGIEPATFGLGSQRSTTELRPQGVFYQ